MSPPLAILQARIHSTRLANKMLLPIGGLPIIDHAHRLAVSVFGLSNVVVACPASDTAPFVAALRRRWSPVFGWDGPDNDVLGRLHACAHAYRDQPHDLIVRITPDDWPIDVTRERFTLAQLDHWHQAVTDPNLREHMGLLMPGRIEINTLEDFERVKAMVEG